MSYDIHITRANHWIQSNEYPISLNELKQYFSMKREFEYSNVFLITVPINISISGEFFVWTNKDMKVPFNCSEGKITVSGANDEIIDKMKEIASELNAHVQGDEGETY